MSSTKMLPGNTEGVTTPPLEPLEKSLEFSAVGQGWYLVLRSKICAGTCRHIRWRRLLEASLEQITNSLLMTVDWWLLLDQVQSLPLNFELRGSLGSADLRFRDFRRNPMGWKTFGVQKPVYIYKYYIYETCHFLSPYLFYSDLGQRFNWVLFSGVLDWKSAMGLHFCLWVWWIPTRQKKVLTEFEQWKKHCLFRLYGVKLYCPLLKVLLSKEV